MPNLEYRVLVDTPIWVDYFRNQDLKTTQKQYELLVTNAVVITGVVVAELIQGAKTVHQASELESLLQALSVVKESESTWYEIGKMARSLRLSGITVPLTDLLLAQLAIENNCLLFSRDSHFENIPGLQRFEVE